MSTRTERLQASNLYKVALIGLAVAVGACLWMLVDGGSWPAAAVVAAVMLSTSFATKAWFSRRS